MRKTAEDKKAALLADVVAARSEILDAARALSPAQQTEVFLGTWSARELLAHLIGWDRANVRAARELQRGELPSFYAYRDPDWRSYNARLVSRHRRGTFRELLRATQESQVKLIAFFSRVPAIEFEKDQGVRFRGYKVTLARLLQADAKDVRVHAAQLRRFAAGGNGTREGAG